MTNPLNTSDNLPRRYLGGSWYGWTPNVVLAARSFSYSLDPSCRDDLFGFRTVLRGRAPLGNVK